jgi:hypothetical protein
MPSDATVYLFGLLDEMDILDDLLESAPGVGGISGVRIAVGPWDEPLDGECDTATIEAKVGPPTVRIGWVLSDGTEFMQRFTEDGRRYGPTDVIPSDKDWEALRVGDVAAEDRYTERMAAVLSCGISRMRNEARRVTAIQGRRLLAGMLPRLIRNGGRRSPRRRGVPRRASASSRGDPGRPRPDDDPDLAARIEGAL